MEYYIAHFKNTYSCDKQTQDKTNTTLPIISPFLYGGEGEHAYNCTIHRTIYYQISQASSHVKPACPRICKERLEIHLGFRVYCPVIFLK